MLSANPTIYTSIRRAGGGSGSGNSGALPYVVGLANKNPNTAGSEIQFERGCVLFAADNHAEQHGGLSETAGRELIDGPGTNLVTVSGNNAVEVFSVDERRDG